MSLGIIINRRNPEGSTRVLIDLYKLEGFQRTRGVQRCSEESLLTGRVQKGPEGSTSVLRLPYQLDGS